MRNRIREIRLEKGISQQKLADEIGVTRQAISLFEKGDRDPKLETWIKLADYFGVSVGYLQGIEEQSTTDIQNQKRWNERERSFLKALRESYMLDGSWEDLAQTFKREWHKHELIDEMQKDPRAKGLNLNVLKVEVPEDELEE